MTPLEQSLARLNPEQRRAVEAIEGQLLILAGAGSGKTGVLTSRLSMMLARGIPPEQMLAVTFTNKAAHEMKERVAKLVGDEAGEKLWIATFHSTCARILRQEIEKLGWTKRFTIYDDDDQSRLIKDIVVGLGYDTEIVKPSELLSQIDFYKNRGIDGPDELVAQRRSHLADKLYRVWKEYEERLKTADAVDFNDLIRLVTQLFARHPDVLAKWRERFRYLMVDEYQDTNRGQYELLRLLAGVNGNLAVVGDDDQSIYGFRGADIGNILGFQRDFPDALVIKLEQNYRCSGNILRLANAVVSKNTSRMDKVLWTKAEPGLKVQLIVEEDPRAEAKRVAAAVAKLKRLGHAYQDIAIIYRTNATSRPFEAALRDERIPHRLVGAKRFYERREVRDVLGYLRLLVNPADDAAVLRVINVPARGIGAKRVGQLRDEAASRGDPLLKVARSRAAAEPKTFGQFVGLIDELTEGARTRPAAELVADVIERSGYRELLASEADAKDPESASRLANLDELIRDASEFQPPDDPMATPMDALRAWLDRIALIGQDEEIPDGGEVTLMTVHNAKGLEYPVVFVVQMVEGQFPHQRSMEQAEHLEEERRLAYVAFTRAKQRLVVTRSRVGGVFARPGAPGAGGGVGAPVAPSRFLFGLPGEAVEGDLPEADAGVEVVGSGDFEETARKRALRLLAARTGARPAPPRARPLGEPPPEEDPPAEIPEEIAPLPRPALASPPVTTPSGRTMEIEDPSVLRVGLRLFVPRQGAGTVMDVSRGGRVQVRFDHGGRRLVDPGEPGVRVLLDD